MTLHYTGTTCLSAADIKIGITAGYNYSYYNSLQFNGLDCTCHPFGEGSGSGYVIGVSAELFRNTFFVDSWVLRIGYQSLPLNETKTIGHQLISFEGEIYNMDIVNNLNITYKSIILDFMYKLNLFGTGFAISAGPSISYNTGTHFLMKEYLDGNMYFIGGEGLKTRELYNGEIPGMNKIRIGLKGGLSYDIEFENSSLSLWAFYNYPVNTVIDLGWKIGALQFGIDYLFEL